jgi:hypothetical protein
VADVALTMWPDHPVADHARLALLRFERAEWGDGWVERVSTLLGDIESPAVRERAALLATSAREPTPELLDQVHAVSPRDPRDALRLATWGIARSVEAGDWARAAAFSELLRPALDDVCALGTASAQVPCEFAQYQLRETVARLVALGVQAPRTWQEALTAAAWRCHLDERAAPGTSRTHARWDGARWTFAPWDRPTAVTACLDGVERTEVAPDELTVRLTVESA